jgi:hypothetical protein
MGQESSQVQKPQNGDATEVTDFEDRAGSNNDFTGQEQTSHLLTPEPSNKRKKKRKSSKKSSPMAPPDNTNPLYVINGDDQQLEQEGQVKKKKKKEKKRARDEAEESRKSKKHRFEDYYPPDIKPASSFDIMRPWPSVNARQDSRELEQEEASARGAQYGNSFRPDPPLSSITDSAEIIQDSSARHEEIIPSSNGDMHSIKKKHKKSKKHRESEAEVIAPDVYDPDPQPVAFLSNVEQEPESLAPQAPTSSWEAADTQDPESINAQHEAESVDLGQEYNEQYDDKQEGQTSGHINDYGEHDSIQEANGQEELDRSNIATPIQSNGNGISHDSASAEPLATPLESFAHTPQQQIGIYLGETPLTRSSNPKRRLPVDDSVMEIDAPKEKRPRRSLKTKTPTSSATKPDGPKVKTPKSASKFEPSSQKTTSSSAQNKSDTPAAKAKAKAFDGAEIDVIRKEMQSYREFHDIDEPQLIGLIHGQAKTALGLWNQVCGALPDRDRWSVIKFCRRRFHNFDGRGKFSPEDDDELRKLYEQFPRSWKKIGEIMNRHPEDCRDRWRNYLICGDKRRNDLWDKAEEEQLKAIVYQCLEAIRAHLRVSQPNREDLKEDINLIDWLKVSELMGGTRSRLQCSTKWKRIVDDEDADKNDSELLDLDNKSWRVQAALKQTAIMSLPEKLQILYSIRESQVGREGKIKWRFIGDEAFQAKWSVVTRKVAWRKLRVTIPGHEQIKLQDLVSQLIDLLERSERDPTSKIFREVCVSSSRKPRVRSAYKSAENVVDDEDDDEPTATPQSSHAKPKRSESPKKKKQKKANGEPAAKENSDDDQDADTTPRAASSKQKRPTSSKKEKKDKTKKKLKSSMALENESLEEIADVPESQIKTQSQDLPYYQDQGEEIAEDEISELSREPSQDDESDHIQQGAHNESVSVRRSTVFDPDEYAIIPESESEEEGQEHVEGIVEEDEEEVDVEGVVEEFEEEEKEEEITPKAKQSKRNRRGVSKSSTMTESSSDTDSDASIPARRPGSD